MRGASRGGGDISERESAPKRRCFASKAQNANVIRAKKSFLGSANRSPACSHIIAIAARRAMGNNAVSIRNGPIMENPPPSMKNDCDSSTEAMNGSLVMAQPIPSATAPEYQAAATAETIAMAVRPRRVPMPSLTGYLLTIAAAVPMAPMMNIAPTWNQER